MDIQAKQDLLNMVIEVLPVRYFVEVGFNNIDLISDPHAIRLDIDGTRYRIAPCKLVERVEGGILTITKESKEIEEALKAA
jgi:hypothetical protein